MDVLVGRQEVNWSLLFLGWGGFFVLHQLVSSGRLLAGGFAAFVPSTDVTLVSFGRQVGGRT